MLLIEHGPATAAELVHRGNLHSLGGRGLAGNMSARLGELVEHGSATVTQIRRCSVTGNEVNEYAATNEFTRRPKKPKVNKTLAKRLRRLWENHPQHRAAIETTARLLQGEKP